MGDRGNIAIKQDDGGMLYLYTHWGGSDIARDLQKALSRRQRWSDPAYLTRIIFDTMTEGQQGEETGYGISTSIQDNEHPILVVDTDAQEVSIEGTETRWSFDEFLALPNPDLTVEG